MAFPVLFPPNGIWRTHRRKAQPSPNRGGLDGYGHLHIDFLKPPQTKQMMGRLQRLFNRTRLTQNEINILRGVLTAIKKSVSMESVL